MEKKTIKRADDAPLNFENLQNKKNLTWCSPTRELTGPTAVPFFRSPLRQDEDYLKTKGFLFLIKKTAMSVYFGPDLRSADLLLK